MEFLIVSSTKNSVPTSTVVLEALASVTLVKPAATRLSCFNSDKITIAVVFGKGEHPASACSFYDGCAVLSGDLYTALRPPHISNNFCNSARGSFCAVWTDSDIVTHVRHDLFGVYPIWSLKSAGLFFTSNNLHAIKKICDALGVVLQRNALHMASELAFENGLWGSSPYVNVTLLKTDERIEIHPSGENCFIKSVPWFYNSNESYATLLDRACNELIENVTAIAEAPFQYRVADLTGGYDSRLIAAAIVSAKKTDAFSFFTSGVNSGDSVAASHIRAKFGLRRAVYQSSGSGAPDQILNIRRSLWASYGHSQMAGFHERTPNVVGLNGVLGEFFRQFYTQVVGEHPVDSIRRRFCERTSLLKKESVERLMEGYVDFFENKKNNGFSFDHALHHLYLEQRNAQFVGISIRAKSNIKPIALPLYSPSGVAATLAVTEKERTQLQVVYDIMRRLESELLFIPLENRRWPKADSRDINRLASVSPFKNGDSELEELHSSDFIAIKTLFNDPRPVVTPWAKNARLHGRRWDHVYLDAALEFGSMSLKKDDVVEKFAEVVDLQKIQLLFNRKPDSFRSNSEIRQVWQLLFSIGWISKNEDIFIY